MIPSENMEALVVILAALCVSPVVKGFAVEGFLNSCINFDEGLLCKDFEFDPDDTNRIQTQVFEISKAKVVRFENARLGVLNENLVNKFPFAKEINIYDCQLSLHSNITSISEPNEILEKLTIERGSIEGNEKTTSFQKLLGLKQLIITNPYYIQHREFEDAMLENNVNLETIVFDRLQLNYLGPNMFSNHQFLKNLTITNNMIPYVSSELFKYNIELENIDLSANGIEDLPLGFFPNSTKTIFLNNNAIQVISDKHFAGLEDLEYLNLAFNKIGIFSKNALSDAEELKVLSLHFNQISAFEREHFANNGDLEEINLSNNKFTSLPNDLFDGLENLKVFKIFE